MYTIIGLWVILDQYERIKYPKNNCSVAIYESSSTDSIQIWATSSNDRHTSGLLVAWRKWIWAWSGKTSKIILFCPKCKWGIRPKWHEFGAIFGHLWEGHHSICGPNLGQNNSAMWDAFKCAWHQKSFLVFKPCRHHLTCMKKVCLLLFLSDLLLR